MPSPSFSLSIHSLTPPTLPPQPDLAEIPTSAYKSSLIVGGPAAATSPLLFTLLLPNARPGNPLFPADRLQVVFTFEGTGSIYLPNVLEGKDFVTVLEADGDADGSGNVYAAQISASEIPRVKVNEGETSAATVSLNAWKREKLLGKWEVGRVEDVGLKGLKSLDIHKRRVEQWKEESEGRKGVV